MNYKRKPARQNRLAFVMAVFIATSALQACSKEKTEAASHLKAPAKFDPHRKNFTCRHQADVMPPIDRQADEWNKIAMETLDQTNAYEQSAKQLNTAEDLLKSASASGHWEATINLSKMYSRLRRYRNGFFDADTDQARKIAENAMKLGIPAAYLLMGDYYMNGMGKIKQDNDRPWDFWQEAADMGNPDAQNIVGVRLTAPGYNPDLPVRASRAMGIKMLECAVSQQSSDGGYLLGIALLGEGDSTPEETARALVVMHDAVKLGSADAARYLFSAFEVGDRINNQTIDLDRSERYQMLGRFLTYRKDFRLPDLDKVMPLPPAKLAAWDGHTKTLVDAAKAVGTVSGLP